MNQPELKPRFELLWVDPEHAEYALAECLPLIEPALPYGDGKYDSIDILGKLKDNTAVLWMTREQGAAVAAGVTWIDDYPNDRRMTIGFAGGDFEALQALNDYVESYAKQMGCTAIEVWGRRGWLKKLKPMGYDYLHTVVRKRL